MDALSFCLLVYLSFFRKSSSCSGSHCQAVSFVSSFRILASMWLRSGMKDPNCTASPQNARRDLMSVGRGKFFIASYFLSSGLIPVDEIICPANSILSPIWNFFFEIVTLKSLHLSRTSRILCCSVSMLSAQISVSSTIFLAQGNPSIIASEWQHHSSDEAFRPIGALRYLNLPCGSKNVVIIELSSSKANSVSYTHLTLPTIYSV